MILVRGFLTAFTFVFCVGGDPKREKLYSKKALREEQGTFDYYPWKGSYTSRQEVLLDQLRSHIDIDMPGSFLPQTLADGHKLRLHNVEGAEMAIQVAIPANERDENVTKWRVDVALIDANLVGLCAVHSQGWWTYEWCYRREVRQFHAEQSSNGLVRDPDWSLGHFNGSEVVYGVNPGHKGSNVEEEVGAHQDSLATRGNSKEAETDDRDAPITEIIQTYIDGQMCDETRGGRRTDVHMRCCLAQRVAAERQGKKMEPISIENVEEPDTCHYRMNICVPSLCTTHEIEKATKHRNSLSALFSELDRLCLQKSEDWWTYELCFGKHLRQFHAETQVSVTARGKRHENSVVIQEYTLGLPPAQSLSNDAWLEGQVKQLPRRRPLSNAPILEAEDSSTHTPVLLLEFTGGTHCDIENRQRAATVELGCGPVDTLLEVKEDTTCHYYVRAVLSSLCQNEAFLQQQGELSTRLVVRAHQTDVLGYNLFPQN
jgi:hypothetical protein